MPNSLSLHRVIAAPRERVYRAFLDPRAMVKWMPPHGFTGEVEHMDARVGGSFRMRFCNFSSGASHGFGGEYLELLPHGLIRYSDSFDDPALPGVMQVTVTLEEVFCGTELRISQEGLPDAIPLAACYLGWQQALELLARLVEPDIRDDA